ncbi:shikimate kinase [Wielerella bovis]|uniref:shikimate kinase n=1 Tax=Wielerella bovis TaxID=2917790 RepID=UPI003D2B5EFC
MENMTGNFFLVGLMGSGKTTLGRQLAQQIQFDFYDSDQVLCERTGVSIPTIFELEGEQGFRERESAVIQDLCQLPNIVLATGGGAVLREENRQYLRQHGIVIYLHVQPEILYERVKNDRNRPLLQVADPLAKFRELYKIRDSIYRQTAHIIVEVGLSGCHTTLQTLLNMIRAS